MLFLRYLLGVALIAPSISFSLAPLSSNPSTPIHKTNSTNQGKQKTSPFKGFVPTGTSEPAKKRAMVKTSEGESPVLDTTSATKYLGHPGIVANRDGEWLWSDHLLNLDKNITVSVEIAKPDDVEVNVDPEKLEAIIGEVFKKFNINVGSVYQMGKPDLPNFHVLVMVYPIKDGYTFAIQTSLLESVLLTRIKLDDSVTMQAVTWDRQSIHIVSKQDFQSELEKSIRDSAEAFGERFAFFDKMRNDEKKAN